MPISFKCPKCAKQYQLKDELAGKQARCTCGAVLKIPQPGKPPGGAAGGGAAAGATRGPAADDPLGSFLDDALSQAPPAGTPASADPTGGMPGGPPGGAAPSPFGAQTPGVGFPSGPVGASGPATNPYMAPTSPHQYGAQTPRRRAPRGKLPAFCLVMFIIDTVLCCLRLGVGCFGIFALTRPAVGIQPGALDVAGVVFNLGIAFFGLTANTLLFMKKPFAPFISVVALLFVLCTLVVGMLNLSQMGNLPGGPPNQQAAQQVGFVIGIGCAIVLPLIINGLYVAALVKFIKWVKG